MKSKSIIILTSNSLRHNYFKTVFAQEIDINVVKTYVEYSGFESNLLHKFQTTDINDINKLHFCSRHNTEIEFFGDIVSLIDDNSNSKYINKGEINNPDIIDEVISLNPDMIITYGCSILKKVLISSFPNKIINVHLGISPYYFGSGTNFHCLVNNELQFEGYTFMYIDEGIDTGEIIHQRRATFFPFDNPHQVGTRLIKDMTKDFVKLIKNFDKIKKIKVKNKYIGKTYKNKDASIEKTKKLYQNFKDGCVFQYLSIKDEIDAKYPLITQDFM